MLNPEKMKKLFAVNPFNQALGGELTYVDEGCARGRVKMEAKHHNVYGGMHGGCMYSLADAISGVAAASYGHYVTTLNGSMNYLVPAKDTEYVYCEANVVRMGRTIGVFDVKLTGDDGTLYATGTFNYYVLEEEM